MLTYVESAPCTTIEWVRENFNVLERLSPRRDVFPSAPGVYTFTVKSLPDDAHNVPGYLTLDTVLTEYDEPLIHFQSTGDMSAQISRENLYPGSVQLWLDNKIMLVPNVDFTVDNESGHVTFLKEPPPGGFITANYRYLTPQIRDIPFYRETSNDTIIPGVIIAFGDRAQQDDKQAIVITENRCETAEVYGGKFDVNMDLVAFTRDSEDREKLSDYIIIKVLEIQNRLGFEGLELLDVSPGGEDEEVYNAESDEYFYESSISLSIRVDWELTLPLPVVVSRHTMTSSEAEQEHGYLDGTAPIDLVKVSTTLGSANVPLVIGRSLTYEHI